MCLDIKGTCQAGKQTIVKIRRNKMKSSKLPIQSTPVERATVGASFSTENGVEASGWLDTLGQVVSTVGPPILGALGI
jgi:hypothetical protein